MLNKIKEFENLSNILEPDSSEREKIRNAIVSYSESFLENIEKIKTYQTTADKGSQLLEFPVKETGMPIDQIIELISHNVDRPGLNPASGGHIAYVPGGGIYPSSLGDYLSDITNRYAGVFYANPGAVRIENILIRWMCQMFGLLFYY